MVDSQLIQGLETRKEELRISKGFNSVDVANELAGLNLINDTNGRRQALPIINQEIARIQKQIDALEKQREFEEVEAKNLTEPEDIPIINTEKLDIPKIGLSDNQKIIAGLALLGLVLI